MEERRFWEFESGPWKNLKTYSSEAWEQCLSTSEIQCWVDLFDALRKYQAKAASADPDTLHAPIFSSLFDGLMHALSYLSRSCPFDRDNVAAMLHAISTVEGMCRMVASSTSKRMFEEHLADLQRAMDKGGVIRINKVKARMVRTKGNTGDLSIEYDLVKEGKAFRLRLNQGRHEKYQREMRELDRLEKQLRNAGSYRSQEDLFRLWEKRRGDRLPPRLKQQIMGARRKRKSRAGRSRRRE